MAVFIRQSWHLPLPPKLFEFVQPTLKHFCVVFQLEEFGGGQPPVLSDILENLSNLRKLEELVISFPIDIKPQFMTKRASTQNPLQLTSVKRLVLRDTFEALVTDLPPIDGLTWCRAIHSVFPELEELSVRALTEDRLNAIQAHVRLLGPTKCSLGLVEK